jgi:hypothetical protein
MFAEPDTIRANVEKRKVRKSQGGMDKVKLKIAESVKLASSIPASIRTSEGPSTVNKKWLLKDDLDEPAVHADVNWDKWRGRPSPPEGSKKP